MEKEKALALQREVERAAREKERRELEEKRKALEEKRKLVRNRHLEPKCQRRCEKNLCSGYLQVIKSLKYFLLPAVGSNVSYKMFLYLIVGC